MDSDRIFLVIVLTVVIVIGVNGLLYLAFRRGNEANIINLTRKTPRILNPWQEEDRLLQELSSMIADPKPKNGCSSRFTVEDEWSTDAGKPCSINNPDVHGHQVVPSGCTLAFGGMTIYRRPMAFARALVKSAQRENKPKDVTLLAFTAGPESDLLVGAGIVSRVRTCYFGLEIFGLAPMFTYRANRGEVQIIEETEASLVLGIRARLARIGFMPGRAWLGTDLPRLRPDVLTITDPYTGEMLMAFPAIKPDVAIIHALRADLEGNAQIGLNKAIDEELSVAAETVIITAEEIVPRLDKADIVAFVQVVSMPKGAAHSCHPIYPVDGKFAGLCRTSHDQDTLMHMAGFPKSDIPLGYLIKINYLWYLIPGKPDRFSCHRQLARDHEITCLFIIVTLGVVILLLVGSFSIGMFVGGVFAGDDTPLAELSPEILPQITVGNSNEDSSQTLDLDTLFNPFWQAWDIVHDQYVDQPVNDVTLMRGAIRGMLASLGDQHSSYMDPEQFRQANIPLKGEYEGIGAWVDTNTEYLTIVSPMPDSPAEKAGLKAGDQVIAIDGEDMTGIDGNLAIRRVLGTAGTR
jgi:acyl CoA:acetate/3-ketoacid CoA transferase alpha subunit